MPITVYVTRDFEQMSDVAAQLVEAALSALQELKPQVVLGLATGNSPTGMYRHLARAANEGRLNSAAWKSFNLDEYIGLPGVNAQQRASHPESYTFFMIESLFGLLKRKPSEAYVPWGTLVEQRELLDALESNPSDWELKGQSKGKAVVIREDARSEYLQWVRRELLLPYTREIERSGGIDLQVLGVGGKGHVAFHESGIPFDVKGLLLVELDRVTQEHAVSDGHFPSLDDCPRYALSMSVDLAFQARSTLILANGSRKTEAISCCLLEPPTAEVPLSYVQTYADRGGEAILVLDEAAAAGLLAVSGTLAERGIELLDHR